MVPCGSHPSSAAMPSTPDWAEWDVEHPPLRAKTRLMLHINSYSFIYNPVLRCVLAMWGKVHFPTLTLSDGSVGSWCCRFQ